MRILYISQYFPPEVGATQTRAFEMASSLVRMGHSVTMLCEFPNHPSGVLPKEYHRKLFERSTMAGIDVLRVWVVATPKKNLRNRLLFYLSFMLSASIVGALFTRGKYDLVYCSSPPLFCGVTGLLISKLKKTKFIFEVRDLWPETAVQLGEISNRLAIGLATQLENRCYNTAARIVVVTNGIKKRLLERGVSSQKLIYIPNGANVELFQYKESERNRYRQEWGFHNHYIVIYAGILGVAQGLETLIKVAQRLEFDPDIKFVLVGEGPRKNDLINLAREQKNITFLPEQPRINMPAILSAADLAVIPLRKVPIFLGALPTKIFDAWACERPVLISIDGEARELIEIAQGGIYTPPEDIVSMAEAILMLKSDPEKGLKLGQNGRQYTERNFSRRVLAEELEQALVEALKE